jgi:hypothetical protein
MTNQEKINFLMLTLKNNQDTIDDLKRHIDRILIEHQKEMILHDALNNEIERLRSL